jgi:endonuclease YncB( thermonuclease family)
MLPPDGINQDDVRMTIVVPSLRVVGCLHHSGCWFAPAMRSRLDQYKYAVAVCNVAGVDLADWLVHSGLAVDWPKYSKGDYASAQIEAKCVQLGIWAAASLSRGAVEL